MLFEVRVLNGRGQQQLLKLGQAQRALRAGVGRLPQLVHTLSEEGGGGGGRGVRVGGRPWTS